MPTIQNLLEELDHHFPWNRVEKWDTVGLHIGDKRAEISDVYVAYEVNDATIDAAIANHVGAIIAYHPLLFRPLASLDYSDNTARLASRIVRADMALICVHSALDGAPPPGALGDALAAQLGLSEVRVGAASGAPQLVRIVTYAPSHKLEAVRAAMWEAGAGKIGLFYDQASFKTKGTGTFRPLEGANPTTGTIGERSELTEVQIEVLAPADKWPAIMDAVRRVHGYEEVAYNVTALLNDDKAHSYGPLRVGKVEAAKFGCVDRNGARKAQSALDSRRGARRFWRSRNRRVQSRQWREFHRQTGAGHHVCVRRHQTSRRAASARAWRRPGGRNARRDRNRDRAADGERLRKPRRFARSSRGRGAQSVRAMAARLSQTKAQ